MKSKTSKRGRPKINDAANLARIADILHAAPTMKVWAAISQTAPSGSGCDHNRHAYCHRLLRKWKTGEQRLLAEAGQRKRAAPIKERQTEISQLFSIGAPHPFKQNFALIPSLTGLNAFRDVLDSPGIRRVREMQEAAKEISKLFVAPTSVSELKDQMATISSVGRFKQIEQIMERLKLPFSPTANNQSYRAGG